MELFWYIVSAVAAGVGTGLAGLSAATVMVPILIVLCPSFAGESGAYHATAIALASDILGSAFTASVYIRHKNVDLRRGGLMFACIVSMCVAGSIAAWHAGHVVLGTFSLFLCVGIGIRFLLKPDTQRSHPVTRGAGRGIARHALCRTVLRACASRPDVPLYGVVPALSDGMGERTAPAAGDDPRRARGMAKAAASGCLYVVAVYDGGFRRLADDGCLLRADGDCGVSAAADVRGLQGLRCAVQPEA